MVMHNWLLFTAIAFIATVTPGPAVLLISSHSVAFGWKRAVFTAFGNITGLFIMSALSVLGLSAIILNSLIIFTVVKFCGAFYLVYLGIRLWRNGFASRDSLQPSSRMRNGKPYALYGQGLLVALSNPKAIAFTTALFPQFINHQVPLVGQFGVLVLTFMLLSFSCLVGYGYAAEYTSSTLHRGMPRFMQRLFGTGFIAAGLMLAFSTRKYTRHL